MNWLLKIVEGPQAGAEVALVTGTRVKIGPADDCDIVLADAALTAFVLDVSERDVTLTTASGETHALRAFEIQTQGTTAFALGPAEGAWQPLVRPAPAAEPEPAPESAPEPASAPDEPAPGASGETPASAGRPRRGRGCGCGCLCAVLFLLLLLLLAAAAWRYWPWIRARRPVEAEKVETAVAAARGWCMSFVEKRKKAEPAPERGPSLADIARQHGLELLARDGHPLLKGNVRLRTERLAIRALALGEDGRTAFDLTDDETLKASSDELLFVVTEGALKAVSASNRVVVLSGYAPNAAELERAVRALNADVPGIDRLETSAVQVGGTPPKAVAKTKFAAVAAKTPVAAAVSPVARRDYPIAGIITKPYPLVVMRNGLRLAEGAQVGTAVIERIEADRLVLRDGKSAFEWRP